MKNILDVGCGQGFQSYVLSKNKNNRVVGIDISKENIEISHKRYPRVNFLVMNAGKMNFKKNHFDEIYAIEVLEHVNNLEKVLNEITRVLKVGGKLIVSVPYYKSEIWLIKLRPTYFKEIHHVRIFKDNELESLCKKSNLVLKKKKRTGFIQHIELYFLFKRKIKSSTQVSIGSWRDNFFTMTLHASLGFFDPMVLKTPLVYFPIWIVGIPIGFVINIFGNHLFPKSLYYEFIKNE